jgi:hypothetical protein
MQRISKLTFCCDWVFRCLIFRRASQSGNAILKSVASIVNGHDAPTMRWGAAKKATGKHPRRLLSLMCNDPTIICPLGNDAKKGRFEKQVSSAHSQGAAGVALCFATGK